MKEMNNCSYAYAVGKLEERWRTLLEEEIDNCVPMTFMVCTAVAGMVSEFRGEEIGLILVALKIVRKVYGIHTKKKELESFIFENVTVAWHTKVVDQCYEYPYEDSEEGDLF